VVRVFPVARVELEEPVGLLVRPVRLDQGVRAVPEAVAGMLDSSEASVPVASCRLVQCRPVFHSHQAFHLGQERQMVPLDPAGIYWPVVRVRNCIRLDAFASRINRRYCNRDA